MNLDPVSCKHRLKDISLKIENADVQPLFTSAKIEKDLKHNEVKPAAVRNQWVVYQYKCGLFDTVYVGYTTSYPL